VISAKRRAQWDNAVLTWAVPLAKKSHNTEELIQKLRARCPSLPVLPVRTFENWVSRLRTAGYTKQLPPLRELFMKREPDRLPPLNPTDVHWRLTDERREALKKAEIFVVTSALNNVELNRPFWKALLGYCKARNAELIVIPARYKNPTTRGEDRESIYRAWWPMETHAYLTDENLQLHEHLIVMGQVRVQATAGNPLEGLEAISRGSSAIFGHAQLALKMVPSPKRKMPKAVYTTGTISAELQYSTTRSGAKANFVHTPCALVVEKDGPRFHVRQLMGDERGGFYDIDCVYYGPNGPGDTARAKALIEGDVHEGWHDRACREATYGVDGIVQATEPEVIASHDVLDAYAVNHHTEKDPVVQIGKRKANLHLLQNELDKVVKFLRDTTPANSERWVVPSNHHDHFTKWLKKATPLSDPDNARILVKMWAEWIDTIEVTERGVRAADPLELYARACKVGDNVRFLGRDEVAEIAGVVVSYHGDHGINGQRGTLQQFDRIGARTVTGHSHTPGIIRGAWAVGTSSKLSLEYTSGPSTWAHAHCLIWPNGKRQLVFVINGKWRREPEKKRSRRKAV
jgi:hypothetical protein